MKIPFISILLLIHVTQKLCLKTLWIQPLCCSNKNGFGGKKQVETKLLLYALSKAGMLDNVLGVVITVGGFKDIVDGVIRRRGSCRLRALSSGFTLKALLRAGVLGGGAILCLLGNRLDARFAHV